MLNTQVSNNAPRVLYLPNEGTLCAENGQVGGRAAFSEMEADGTIRELQIYSFLADYYSRGKDRVSSQQALLEVVQSFKPDIIFWQHPSRYPVDSELIRKIRECGSSPLLAYHEGDPFDSFYKVLHPEVKTLYRESDVFFTIGLGDARRRFSRIRQHPHFYYNSHCFDRERVGVEPPSVSTLGSKYDAIMIGTIAARFRGFFKQPQSKNRVRLARGLAQLFGNRFAAFGRGWPLGTNGAGLIPFETQAKVIQTSRMSVIWELYSDYTFYFSDRLPIALAAGVPFVTNSRSGYDTVLANAPGVYKVDSIEDALDVALYLRSLPMETIAEIGAAGRAWAFENLEARVVFRRAFRTCEQIWRERESGRVGSCRI
jgi:hypothetical protein